MLVSFIFLQFCITSAHVFMNDPPSRKNKYSKEYTAQGNVDYNIMAPLYYDGSTYPFPCKGFPKGPSTKTINGNIVNIKLEGSAIHGGGHCQFGVTYDDSKFVVLKTVIGNCLTSGMNYNFDLPPNIPSGDITVFWTWINKIGNREYYMECADITVNNSNGNNSPVEIQGKELLVVNILGKTIIPEGFPSSNDGINLLNARKDISIINSGPPSQYQGPSQSPNPTVSNPTVSNPTVSNPTVSNPTVSNPTVSDPTVSNPTVSDPIVSDPTRTRRTRTRTRKIQVPTSIQIPPIQSPTPLEMDDEYPKEYNEYNDIYEHEQDCEDDE